MQIQTSAFPSAIDLTTVPVSRFSTRPFSRLLVLGAVSILVGVLWDISWHRTIGRDTFWTPAHLAIYLGGALGGLVGGWLVLRTTFFGSTEDHAGAVRVWGFRGPFGAWISIWGSVAMLTSAPFDNWWHDAYGLDVKILSPPHSVLALGMWAVVLGALLLVLREQNTAPRGEGTIDSGLFLLASGILLAMASVFLIEHSFPNDQHAATFYRVSSLTYPLYLIGMARASRSRWAATWIALIYMGLMASMGWILPLFPGQPKLGPIYHQVTHFVPMPFPLLLVVPALAIDLVRGWIGQGKSWWRDWLLVFAVAAVFSGLFLLTQWSFSEFMLTPASHNWFFAGDRHWGYTENLGPWRQEFWSDRNPHENPPLSQKAFALSCGLAILSSRIGLWLGNWMARVRR